MRWFLSTIILLFSLTGCIQSATPATPVWESSTTPSPTLNDAQHRVTPTDSASESTVGEFGIYLVMQEISLEQMRETNLSELELEDTPILSVDDIVTYDWETHEIRLTASASERITRLEGSMLGGLAFAVCVGGEPVYIGAFWTSYSSATFDGTVIDVYPAKFGQPVPIKLGYPSPEWFAGEDLRSDPRIFRSLKEAGKLE
jgi:hypothetical protein